MIKNSVKKTPEKAPEPPREDAESGREAPVDEAPREIGGRGGLDPVRYGDWEKNGRCIDF